MKSATLAADIAKFYDGVGVTASDDEGHVVSIYGQSERHCDGLLNGALYALGFVGHVIIGQRSARPPAVNLLPGIVVTYTLHRVAVDPTT